MTKKKNISPSHHKERSCQPDQNLLSADERIDRAIPENQGSGTFDENFIHTCRRMYHWTFRRIMERTFAGDEELKQAIMTEGELEESVASTILKKARTTYQTALARKETQIEDHNQKIRDLVSEIEKLENERTALHSSVENWSRPPRGAVKKLDQLKAMLWSKKDELHRYRQAVQKLEKEVRTGVFSYCFER